MSHDSNAPDLTTQAQLAVQLYRQGQAEAALVQAEQILRRQGATPGLLNLAATCARSLGRMEQAAYYWQQARRLAPDNVAIANNLALLLKAAGRSCEAETIFRETLEQWPEHADTLVNLGNLYRDMDRSTDAEKAYRSALSSRADHVDALYNLGLLLAASERPEDAEAAFRLALEIRPDQADAYNELGKILADKLKLDEAEATYRKAIALAPNFMEAYTNLAILMRDCRRFQEAWDIVRRAVRLSPDHPDALNIMGNLLKDAGKIDEAETAYRRILAGKPDAVNVLNNLGNLLMAAGRFAEAESRFRHAVLLEPDYGHALGQAITCALRRCAWSQYEADRTILRQATERGVKGLPILTTFALLADDARVVRAACARTAEHFLRTLPRTTALPNPATPAQHGRLHVGYISAEFREHAVMHLFAGVLSLHDRNRFKLHAYSIGPAHADAYRQRIESSSEVFRDFSQTADLLAARQIADDEIDILVDLTGLTGDARPTIAALRPAPVLVNWLGHPGSMGDPRLADYIIGDPVLTPPEHAANYSEHLALMPHCYQPNDPVLAVGPAPTRAEAGLPPEGFIFCSFNQSYKLNPEMFTLWCRLLDAIPGSVLWLLRPVDSSAMDNLRKEASARGIDPARLVFAPALPLARHLERLQLADLALDTYPYGSGATGSNILRAGVPMVTLMGESYVSRMAASQLHAVCLPELVTTTPEAYFQLALALATDPARLTNLRRRLRDNLATSPLFDAERFTRDLEALYEKIWAHTLAGRPGRVVA